jgi:restriction endonuclease Mrr
LDWLMELPQDLKQAFRNELEQYEQERQMPYITSIEQMAKEESKAEMAVKMLQEKIAVEVIVRVTGLSPEALRQLQVSQGT